MTEMAIEARGLGKRYKITHRRDAYPRLTESLWNALRAPIDRLRAQPRDPMEWVWALRDVSFEVTRGSVVGIIGRNGAGKSTLLKVLSRITEPTTGEVILEGRVGSLLEVGTGFHPELTGRENVFMSGAVLGMRRTEITRKFDEIVDFAGIGQFLDTPVKRYSSGMQVRLGFAVAAHLEPEILFIDEVLAVGDAEFQKRCLGKISEIGRSGRTILFVSHSMPSVLRLCDRALLLDRGRAVTQGPTPQVVRAYLESDLGTTSERRWTDSKVAPGDEVARLHSVRVIPSSGGPADEVDIREAIDIEILYRSSRPDGLKPSVNLHFFNEEGICLFVTNDWNDRAWWDCERGAGMVRAVCRIPGNFLAEGRVSIHAAVSTYNPLVVHAQELDAVAFQVVDRSMGDGVRGTYPNDWPGVVRPMLEWHVGMSSE
jgi:lipopolysaccharide transport system ATP-binding protein